MPNRIILFIFLAIFALCSASFAATNVVVQGANFQQAINAAAPGDTLVVQSGIYSGDLNFDRSLTVLCSGTQIQFTGTTSITNNATVSFSQTQFVGLVQTATNTSLILSQSTCSNGIVLAGGSLQAFDTQFLSLNATGGKATLKRCSSSSVINLTATSFEALRLTASGKITSVAPVGSGTRFILVQSTTGAVWASGCQVYVAYSSLAGDSQTSGTTDLGFNTLVNLVDCNTFMVGNLIYQLSSVPAGGPDKVAVMVEGGTVKAYNNRIDEEGYIRILIFYLKNNGSGELMNNTFYGGADSMDLAVLVENSVGPIVLRANVVEANLGLASDILGPITECSYSSLQSGSFANVPETFCLVGDAQINTTYNAALSPANSWLALSPGSPCIHTGPPDTIYNNTDGTRNTMGYTGGPMWNPANYTNNNPMVFFLAATNQTVLKGVQSTIQINVGASAGH